MNARSNVVLHRSKLGRYLHSRIEVALSSGTLDRVKGKVQLIVTSPPFPLNTKKSYGNRQGKDYLDWLAGLAAPLSELLTPTGSIVIEVGNAWEPGRPVQSLLPLQSLLAFAGAEDAALRVCQQFICYNPARLPSPAQWVTVERERVTDSYTQVWWLAKTDRPYADNSKVLRPYSNSMRSLLQEGSFNTKRRPSQHHISERAFLSNNGGSIAHNVFELEALTPRRPVRLPNAFALANTGSNDAFTRTCAKKGIVPHPARMPAGLAAFFVQFLTKRGDLVLDPFAGSNTTGFVAEVLGRRWLSLDAEKAYAIQSRIRFQDPLLRKTKPRKTRTQG